MKFNKLIKGLFCSTLLFTFKVTAKEKNGECKNIEKFTFGCRENAQGEIIEIDLRFGLSENELQKIFSYKTIKDLDLIMYKNINQSIIDRVCSLPNLEKLSIATDVIYDKNANYECLGKLDKLLNFEYFGTFEDANNDDNKLETTIIKYLKNLKNLIVLFTKLNKNDVNLISDLKSLEKLEFSGVNIDHKINLENLKELKISDSIIGKDIISGFKNLKKLVIDGQTNIQQYHIKEIAMLSNLEYINLDFNNLDYNNNEEALDFSLFKNLKKLSYCFISNEVAHIKMDSLKGIKNLNLKITVFKQSELNEIKNLSNLKNIHIELFKDNIKDLDISFLKNNTNLSELTIQGTYDRSDNYTTELKKNILKGFNNIKSLKLLFIKFNQNDIDDIAELSQLNELTFDRCDANGVDFEPLNKLSNLKSIDFNEVKNINGSTLTNKN